MEKKYSDYLDSPIESYEVLKEEIDIIINRNKETRAEKRGGKKGRKSCKNSSC